MNAFKIGDKVWMIRTFEEIYYKNQNDIPKEYIAIHPIQKKIAQVVTNKDGSISYGVKGGHFYESWIGIDVFQNKDDAEIAMKEKFKEVV